jgi:hypothetical protein
VLLLNTSIIKQILRMISVQPMPDSLEIRKT